MFWKRKKELEPTEDILSTYEVTTSNGQTVDVIATRAVIYHSLLLLYSEDFRVAAFTEWSSYVRKEFK